MTGKEEIEVKKYMEGKYVTGVGKAHNCCRPHKFVFNHDMLGTFNVRLKSGRITEFQPSIITEKANYYFVNIRKSKYIQYGWAIRDHTSKQAISVLEIITKEKVPDFFKEGNFAVNVFERWDEEQTKVWADKQYWFQTFPFSPKPKADSEMLWNTINVIPWSGMQVLDIGAHYGYFSFKASEKGARVVGVEPNRESFKCACIIRDRIVQQDVRFQRHPSEMEYDVILYLSVHHQIDPAYKKLKRKIATLKSKTRKHLFVELILPPMFPKGGKLSEKDVDQIVQMKTLLTYKHNVRGRRRVYSWSPDEES